MNFSTRCLGQPLMLTLLWLGACWPAAALQPASGKVVLTISGRIAERNAGAQAKLDMLMIEQLPQKSFTTLTPWSKKAIKFSGPLLRDLLALVKADGSQITAVALNDYKVIIPLDDVLRYDVLVATRMDDQPMPVRTRGPLFVIYPFDSHPHLQSTRYHERSIWQLKALELN